MREEWCLILLWVPHQFSCCSLTVQKSSFDPTEVASTSLWEFICHLLPSGGEQAPADSEEHIVLGIGIIGLDYSASAIERTGTPYTIGFKGWKLYRFNSVWPISLFSISSHSQKHSHLTPECSGNFYGDRKNTQKSPAINSKQNLIKSKQTP